MTEDQKIALSAKTRELQKKQVQQLRDEAIIPAVLYGHVDSNAKLQINKKELLLAYEKAGGNTLIDLSIDEAEPIKVIIQDLQTDVITDNIQHVNFYAVNMKEKITVDVVLNYVGVAPAVKQLGGTLVKNKDVISVQCLPQDLIKEIDVDIASLETFENTLTVADVKFPDTIEVLDEADRVLAIITPPRSEEELAGLDEAVSEDVSEVEGVEKEESSDDEGEKDSKEESSDKSEDDDKDKQDNK